jgi:hypothetical protein
MVLVALIVLLAEACQRALLVEGYCRASDARPPVWSGYVHQVRVTRDTA